MRPTSSCLKTFDARLTPVIELEPEASRLSHLYLAHILGLAHTCRRGVAPDEFSPCRPQHYMLADTFESSTTSTVSAGAFWCRESMMKGTESAEMAAPITYEGA